MQKQNAKDIIKASHLLDIVQIHTTSKRWKETKSLFVLYHPNHAIVYLVAFTRAGQREKIFLKDIYATKKIKQLYTKTIYTLPNGEALALQEPNPEILAHLDENSEAVQALYNARFTAHPAKTELTAWLEHLKTPKGTILRSVRIDTRTDEKARKQAKKQKITYSEYINRALKEFTEKFEELKTI